MSEPETVWSPRNRQDRSELARKSDVEHSKPGRISSLDALRGFTIFWILGGDGIAWSLAEMAGKNETVLAGVGRWVGQQLTHVRWEGLRFYDLVFPLLIFTTGVAVVISLSRLREREDLRSTIQRVARRTLILFVLGLIYYGGVSAKWPDVRILGVLQRIALCYLAASLLFLSISFRGLVIVLLGILVGYWALLTFVPVPGPGAGSYSESGNLTIWVDQNFLPGKKWNGSWDPEGLLSTLPAIGSCLIGVLAGYILTNQSTRPERKSLVLLASGFALLAGGYAWSLQFPIVKGIWTSSFVLVTGGWSLLLLASMHHVIDVWRVKRWSSPFIWVGANAITLYFIQNIVRFEQLARRIVGGDVAELVDRAAGPGAGRFLAHAVGLALAIALAHFLYVRKIFIRV